MPAIYLGAKDVVVKEIGQNLRAHRAHHKQEEKNNKLNK